MEQALWYSLFVIISCITLASSLDNGLAITPPMGWLSWERFLCNVDCEEDPDNCISEKLYMQMADRLVADGFKDVGYEYVNIDDCWASKQRDNNSCLVADPKRFPSGIKALADYVHSKGLKLGIYGDIGTLTCGGYPGTANHIDIDAETFAEWEVDMLKLDGCYADPKDMDNTYPQMTAALNRTGRPILYSCSWPDYQRSSGISPNYDNIAKYCNIWRNYNDIADSWTSILTIVDYYALVQNSLIEAAGPGHWNDPDMLIIGNFGLSYYQAKAQMALWAVLSAPLLMSNDLRNLQPEFRELLLNIDLIAINQDKLGKMGKRIYSKDNIEIWIKAISPVKGDDTSFAVVIFNRRNMGSAVKVSVILSSIGLNHSNGYECYDVFEHKTLGDFNPNDSLTVAVDPSSVTAFVAKVK